MSRIVSLAVLVALGCTPTHHVRLSDGAGLAEGSPVIVSSVRVGEVRSVRVVEGFVDVELAIDRAHEITLRTDGCAHARRTEAGPELVVMPGTGEALPEGGTLMQCELGVGEAGDFLRNLGESMNEMLRQLGGGSGGSRTSTQPSSQPSTQPSSPPSPAPSPAPPPPLPPPPVFEPQTP